MISVNISSIISLGLLMCMCCLLLLLLLCVVVDMCVFVIVIGIIAVHSAAGGKLDAEAASLK